MSKLADRLLGQRSQPSEPSRESDVPPPPPRDVVRIKDYYVRWVGNEITCTCGHFKNKRTRCKHIDKLDADGRLPEKPISKLAQGLTEVSDSDIAAETRDTLSVFPRIRSSVFPMTASGILSHAEKIVIQFSRTTVLRDGDQAVPTRNIVTRTLTLVNEGKDVQVAWSSGGKNGTTVMPASSEIDQRQFRNGLWQLTIMGSGGQLAIEGQPMTWHMKDGTRMIWDEWYAWRSQDA